MGEVANNLGCLAGPGNPYLCLLEGLTHKLEGLVVVAVGTVTLSKSPNKVDLVRLVTCAGNHLCTLWVG